MRRAVISGGKKIYESGRLDKGDDRGSTGVKLHCRGYYFTGSDMEELLMEAMNGSYGNSGYT